MTNRFISIFSQLLPFLAYKLNLSLPTVLAAYSINMFLIPFSLIITSLLWFKETKTAISILLFYTLMNNHLFFYPAGEFQMGLCVVLFLNGLYDFYLMKHSLNKSFIIISFFLILVIVFSHPISFLVFVVWCVWRLLDNPKTWKYSLGGVLLAVIYNSIKNHFFAAAYDSDKAKGIDKFFDPATDFFTSRMALSFFDNLVQNYSIVFFVMIATLLCLIYLKKYLMILLYAGILISFWLLVTVSFNEGTYGFYIEHMYQPITFIISLFFAQYISIIKIKYIELIIVPVLIISIYGILNGKGREEVEERHKWYNKCIAEMKAKGIKKGILSLQYVPGQSFKDTYWCSGEETLLLSSLNGPTESQTLLLVYDKESTGHDLKQTNAFFMAGWSLPLRALPSLYFRLPETKYEILDFQFNKQQLQDLKND